MSGYTGNGPAFFSMTEKNNVYEIVEYMSRFGRTFIVEAYRHD